MSDVDDLLSEVESALGGKTSAGARDRPEATESAVVRKSSGPVPPRASSSVASGGGSSSGIRAAPKSNDIDDLLSLVSSAEIPSVSAVNPRASPSSVGPSPVPPRSASTDGNARCSTLYLAPADADVGPSRPGLRRQDELI
jgi:hypothetical protein